MTIGQTQKRSRPRMRVPARKPPKVLARVLRHTSQAARTAGRLAERVIGRLPGTVHATQAGAHGTTTALQTLPDSTLRLLAASSVGLGAGFYLAGAPRLLSVAGIAPALVMGAAIILRPVERPVTEADR